MDINICSNASMGSRLYSETKRLYSETYIRVLQNDIRKLGRWYSETGTVVFGNWRDLRNYEEQRQDY